MGIFYRGPSLLTVGWTNLFQSGNRLELERYVLLQTLPFGHHLPTSNRWTDGLDERTIIKGIFFYPKTLHIQSTCQKCFQTHLATNRNVIGNWDNLKVEYALPYNHVPNISNTPFKRRIGGRRSVFKDRLSKNEETASVCLSVQCCNDSRTLIQTEASHRHTDGKTKGQENKTLKIATALLVICFDTCWNEIRTGIAQSVQRLATGWTVRGSNPGGGEIFRTCPDRPWGPPSLIYNGYRIFPGGKVAWLWPTTHV